MKLIVKILSNSAVIPTYGSSAAAGLDLYADEDCEIEKGGRRCISTNICIEWVENNQHDENPINFYLRIAPRSGMCVRNGIQTGAGVIDYDYRGEIKVVLINHGEHTFTINKGDRIAQAILTRIIRFSEIILQDELTETDRGKSGFGSTGNK
jgi:dUTP pyrophosphatase